MTDFTAPHVDWAHLSPVLIVLGAAAIGVLLEAFVPARRRRTVQLAFTARGARRRARRRRRAVERREVVRAACACSAARSSSTARRSSCRATIAAAGTRLAGDHRGPHEHGRGRVRAVGRLRARLGLRGARRAASGVQQTEVYPLVLFATGGMLIFPATGDLLTLFVALEVLSLPLYLLTGMARRRRLLSQEAAMKYFLLGAFASALMLFGIGLVYGYAGSLSYSDDRRRDRDAHRAWTPLLLVGAVMLLAGLLFKIGAVPFHSWTPDVYQGAPTPITGFMAACTKVAAFGALLRVVYTVIPGLQVGPRRGAVDGHDPDDGRRHRHRHGPDGHEAAARLLLGRARGLHPHRCRGARRVRRLCGAVLPAGLRRGHDRCVRHRLARARARRRRGRPRRGDAPVAVGRDRPRAPLARRRVRAVPVLLRGHPADRRLRREVRRLLGRGRRRRLAARAARRARRPPVPRSSTCASSC